MSANWTTSVTAFVRVSPTQDDLLLPLHDLKESIDCPASLNAERRQPHTATLTYKAQQAALKRWWRQ